MKSLPTVEQVNLENYLEVVRTLDPELYLIKIALEEARVNPLIIPKVIRSIGRLSMGERYGTIHIVMHSGIITQIQGEETMKVHEKASVDNY